jgi:hypothetical protein
MAEGAPMGSYPVQMMIPARALSIFLAGGFLNAKYQQSQARL